VEWKIHDAKTQALYMHSTCLTSIGDTPKVSDTPIQIIYTADADIVFAEQIILYCVRFYVGENSCKFKSYRWKQPVYYADLKMAAK